MQQMNTILLVMSFCNVLFVMFFCVIENLSPPNAGTSIEECGKYYIYYLPNFTEQEKRSSKYSEREIPFEIFSLRPYIVMS